MAENKWEMLQVPKVYQQSHHVRGKPVISNCDFYTKYCDF